MAEWEDGNSGREGDAVVGEGAEGKETGAVTAVVLASSRDRVATVSVSRENTCNKVRQLSHVFVS